MKVPARFAVMHTIICERGLEKSFIKNAVISAVKPGKVKVINERAPCVPIYPSASMTIP